MSACLSYSRLLPPLILLAAACDRSSEPVQVSRCLDTFDRIVVEDDLLVHICPPLGDANDLDRWTGDPLCEGTASDSDEGCSDTQVAVDVIAAAERAAEVRADVREGGLWLRASAPGPTERELAVDDQVIKLLPAVVLVRESVRNIEAMDDVQVVVEGINDERGDLQVEARDRAQVQLAGVVDTALLALGEQARVHAGDLSARRVEVKALGDADDSHAYGGLAHTQVCAADEVVLTHTPACSDATDVYAVLTHAVDVEACCTSAPYGVVPTASLRCADDSEALSCVPLPTCTNGVEADDACTEAP